MKVIINRRVSFFRLFFRTVFEAKLITDTFTLKAFLEEPTLHAIDLLKESQLLEVVSYYKVEVNSSQKKNEIKQVLIDNLINKEIIPEDDVSTANITDENTLELQCLEMQDREKEKKYQLRLKELEICEKELAMQVRLKELDVLRASTSTAVPKFDISKQIRFVPLFQEKEVDKYFLHFEKIVPSLEWPSEVWTLFLQSVLVGKAREVYSSMTVEQSAQYELVKSTILKAYEPEAY